MNNINRPTTEQLQIIYYSVIGYILLNWLSKILLDRSIKPKKPNQLRLGFKGNLIKIENSIICLFDLYTFHPN